MLEALSQVKVASCIVTSLAVIRFGFCTRISKLKYFLPVILPRCLSTASPIFISIGIISKYPLPGNTLLTAGSESVASFP